jgi:hypothetical protein
VLKARRQRTDPASMSLLGTDIEEDLNLLDARMKQLRVEYEQYFLGSRKREPQLVRGEVQKIVSYYANVSIRNTGYRFRFNNLRARFFTLRRHWDDTLRKMEEGRYDRHRFQADLHERERGIARGAESSESEAAAPPVRNELDELLAAWSEARVAAGQGGAVLSRERLAAQLEQQRAAIRERFGVAEVRFRVVVEDGRAKLKATPVGASTKRTPPS